MSRIEKILLVASIVLLAGWLSYRVWLVGGFPPAERSPDKNATVARK